MRGVLPAVLRDALVLGERRVRHFLPRATTKRYARIYPWIGMRRYRVLGALGHIFCRPALGGDASALCTDLICDRRNVSNMLRIVLSKSGPASKGSIKWPSNQIAFTGLSMLSV